MDEDFRTLCNAYIGLLRRARDEGYPIGVKADATVEHALTDWEAAAALPPSAVDVPLTVANIKRAREAINDVLEGPIEAVSHRKGRETWAWHAGSTASTSAASTSADGDTSGDVTTGQPTLFDEQREAAASKEAVA